MSTFAVIDTKSLQVLNAYGSLPDFVVWPNGDVSYGAYVGYVHGNEMFVSIIEEPDQPNEFYSRGSIAISLRGSALVQTITWVPMDIVPVKQQLLDSLDAAIVADPNLILSLLTGTATTYVQQRAAGITAINSAQTVDAAVVAHDTAVDAVAAINVSLATAVLATAVLG